VLRIFPVYQTAAVTGFYEVFHLSHGTPALFLSKLFQNWEISKSPGRLPLSAGLCPCAGFSYCRSYERWFEIPSVE